MSPSRKKRSFDPNAAAVVTTSPEGSATPIRSGLGMSDGSGLVAWMLRSSTADIRSPGPANPCRDAPEPEVSRLSLSGRAPSSRFLRTVAHSLVGQGLKDEMHTPHAREAGTQYLTLPRDGPQIQIAKHHQCAVPKNSSDQSSGTVLAAPLLQEAVFSLRSAKRAIPDASQQRQRVRRSSKGRAHSRRASGVSSPDSRDSVTADPAGAGGSEWLEVDLAP
ncbi:hypothetical protein VTI74DRAFT_6494 [Chaetomium olivicolor]